MFKLIFSVLFVVVVVSSCAIVTPKEFKAQSDISLTIPSNYPPQELSDCLVPHMEEAKFYISKNRLIAHARKIGDIRQIYAVTGDYTLYLVEIYKAAENGSVATLFAYKRHIHSESLHDIFVNGMKACDGVLIR